MTDPQYSPYEPVPILQNAPQATVQYLDTHTSRVPRGLGPAGDPAPVPPGTGQLAAYVLGYVGAITGTELKAHPEPGLHTVQPDRQDRGRSPSTSSTCGASPGKQELEVDAQGNVVGTLNQTTEPTQGDTVVLNLTAGLQKAAQQALTADMAADQQDQVHIRQAPEATDGAVVVLDAETGAVLALASYPTYSLDNMGGRHLDRRLRRSCRHLLPGRRPDACPLDDYAIQGLYTPGSTFKLATATAALQTGLIGPNNVRRRHRHLHRRPNCTVRAAPSTTTQLPTPARST